MTGGISSGVRYFGTDAGLSVPPAISAIALRSPPTPVANSVKVVAPVYLRNVLLEIIAASP
jgi:hypothetical protein